MCFKCNFKRLSFRTALILGCEYGCKDAVEVLLRNGADVTAVDGFGHDGYHYARLSKNQELVTLVKSYLESATKGTVHLSMTLNCVFLNKEQEPLQCHQ